MTFNAAAASWPSTETRTCDTAAAAACADCSPAVRGSDTGPPGRTTTGNPPGATTAPCCFA
ncbi:hypothetical protein GCM10010532_091620 [Dactylosporangium siamense]